MALVLDLPHHWREHDGLAWTAHLITQTHHQALTVIPDPDPDPDPDPSLNPNPYPNLVATKSAQGWASESVMLTPVVWQVNGLITNMG